MGWWIFFSLFFFFFLKKKKPKTRVMGNIEWEAVLTATKWVSVPRLSSGFFYPSLEKMAFSWARLRAELGGSCGTYLGSLSSGRGLCGPRLGPWLSVNCLKTV